MTQTGNYLHQCLRDLYDHFGQSWGKVEKALNKAAVELDLIPWEQRDKISIVTRKKLPVLATSNSERFSVDFLTALNKVMADVFAQDLTSKPLLYSNHSIVDLLGTHQRIDILFGTRFTSEYYGQAASRMDLLALMEFVQSDKLKQTRVIGHDVIFRKRRGAQTMDSLIEEINVRGWNKLIENNESNSNPLIAIGTPFVNNASEKALASIFDIAPFRCDLHIERPVLPVTFYYTHQLATEQKTANSSFQITTDLMQRLSDSRKFTIPRYSIEHLAPETLNYRWVYPLHSTTKDPVFLFDSLSVPEKMIPETTGTTAPESSSKYRRAIVYGNSVLISNKRDELRSDIAMSNINFGVFAFRKFPQSGRIVGCLCGIYGPATRILAKLAASERIKSLLPHTEKRPTVLIGIVALVVRKRTRGLSDDMREHLENYSYNEIGFDIREIEAESPREPYLKALDLWEKQEDGSWAIIQSLS